MSLVLEALPADETPVSLCSSAAAATGNVFGSQESLAELPSLREGVELLLGQGFCPSACAVGVGQAVLTPL